MSSYYGYGRPSASQSAMQQGGSGAYNDSGGYGHSVEHNHGQYSSYNIPRGNSSYHQQQQSYSAYPQQQQQQPQQQHSQQQSQQHSQPPPQQPLSYQPTTSQGYFSRASSSGFTASRLEPSPSKRDKQQKQHSLSYYSAQGTENKGVMGQQQTYGGYGSKTNNYSYTANGDGYTTSYPESGGTYTSSSSVASSATYKRDVMSGAPPSAAQAVISSQASTAASAAAAAVVAAAAAAAAASQSAVPGNFPTYDSSKYIGFDSSAYMAANSSYYQPSGSQPQGRSSWKTAQHSGAGDSGKSYSRSYPNKEKKTGPPTPQMYCEVCKVSCVGPQAYSDHLEGAKHRKKVAAAELARSAGSKSTDPPNSQQYSCPLCDIVCTGENAFTAHIKGAKHLRTLKLHQRMGKEIPEIQMPSTASKEDKIRAAAKVSLPKVTFVGGSKLSTTDEKEDEKTKDTPASAESNKNTQTKESSQEEAGEATPAKIEPVGEEFVVVVSATERPPRGGFYCKLCECHFTDNTARDLHVRGRRHRLAYKKEHAPDLRVELQPSRAKRRALEEQQRRQAMNEEYRLRKEAQKRRWKEEEELRLREEEHWRKVERDRAHRDQQQFWDEGRHHGYDDWGRGPPREEPGYYDHGFDYMGGSGGYEHSPREYGRDDYYSRGYDRSAPSPPGHSGPLQGAPRLPPSVNDKLTINKHSQIYPHDNELQNVQAAVADTEQALKLVSDVLGTEQSSSVKTGQSPGDKDGQQADKKSPTKATGNAGDGRLLKGVLRTGILSKGLLLHGDHHVQLAMLCAEKPTRSLLEKVYQNLPEQLAKVNSEMKYDVGMSVDDASVSVCSTVDPCIHVTVTLTAPQLREPATAEETAADEAAGVLDRQKCAEALAELRRTKWFQSQAHGLPSCVVALRVMRDLCRRMEAWAPLPQWALELLVQKSISTLNPIENNAGSALQRLLEILAAGILLPGGPGLLDPCEKETTDAAACLTQQQREDLTASAQHALRLLTFRQFYRVLGMDPPAKAAAKKRSQEDSEEKNAETAEPAAKKLKTDDSPGSSVTT